jgi:hypothetical protein
VIDNLMLRVNPDLSMLIGSAGIKPMPANLDAAADRLHGPASPCSLDLEVLKTAAAWQDAGHRCELVTVIKTWGSSPRPIGATLADPRRRPRGRLGVGRLHRGRPDRPRARTRHRAHAPRKWSATASAPTKRTASACPAAAPSSW